MPTLTPTPGVPFTRRQGLAAGLTQREMEGPGYLRLHHGCFVSAHPQPTSSTLIQAAFLLAPRATFVCHETAARLFGAVMPDATIIHLGTLKASRSKRESIIMRCCTEAPRVRLHRGVSSTTPEQTFLDLAERLGLVDLVVLGDSLVRKGVTTRDRLADAVRISTARGARFGRRAVDFVAAGVDSPQESRLRMLMVLAGLPAPEVDIVIRDMDGDIRRRLDLGWRAPKVAVEYDGRQHVTSDEAWRADLKRREGLANEGWAVVVVTAHDLRADPDHVLDRISAPMQAQGMRVPRRCDDWRRHFPPC